MKKIKPSSRGLTFSLEDDKLIGTKFRYMVDVQKNQILILADQNGTGTVSRKKCGKRYKPLYDIRSQKVKELVSSANYLEVETFEDRIVVSIYKAVKEVSKRERSKIIRIEDVLAVKSGEIVLLRAVGDSITVSDEYLSKLSSSCKYFGSKNDKRNIQSVYTVASLFCGGGLLDYAWSKDPAFKFLYAVDFNKDAIKTYQANIGNHAVCKDIREVKADEVPETDVVIGGPCCQGYSNANRHDIKKETAKEKRLLIDDYVRLVHAKRPKVFVVENVPQLLTAEEGLYLSKILDGLFEYEITYKVISDERVGGYSTRKRAIVIGSRIGKIELPDAEICSYKTVRDALEKVDSSWYNYEDVTIPREETRIAMSYVPQGGNWEDIPEEIHKFGPSTQSNIYRRLAWDEPSIALVNWRKANILHPEEDRILNVSEAAAIMGLDKDFHVLGNSLDSKQQIIGNGVTQAMSKIIKRFVKQALDENAKREGKIIAFS